MPGACAQRRSLLSQGSAVRPSIVGAPTAVVAVRESFSLNHVVVERYRKMLRFKRALAERGLLGEGGWDLTDRDAVDELASRYNEWYEEARASRLSRGASLRQSSRSRQSKGSMV
ncbi:unnamed protein product [Prorocentrum cordatum]|uniref:Uncharacterized protein n=1 Tax=Prorocentrum cordatum TaxID=2364126 RepID=A0ABN9Q960_9DINO|nr:unnamed protein product [Polarella glacialis]